MSIQVFAGAHRQVLVVGGDEILFRGTLRADWMRSVHAYLAQQHHERPNRFFDEAFETRRGEVPIVLNQPGILLDVPEELNAFPWELLFPPGAAVGRRIVASARTPVLERVCVEQVRLVACQHPVINGELNSYAHFNSLRDAFRSTFAAPVLSDVAHSRDRFVEILHEGVSLLYVVGHCDPKEGLMFEEGPGVTPQWLRETLDAAAVTLPPIIVLNCCGWGTNDFASVLLHRGASVVIAAFSPILIRGMAMFGEVFLRKLLERRNDRQRLSIGEALGQTNHQTFGGGVYLSAYGAPLLTMEPPQLATAGGKGRPRRIVIVHQHRVVESIELDEGRPDAVKAAANGFDSDHERV